jgi:WD40 repeat protein
MKISMLYCRALTICVAAAMLAGCGGSQPPSARSGARQPVYQKSNNPAAKPGRNLLYASTHAGEVYIFSYPSGEYLNALVPGATDIGGLCTDTVGDVFVATRDGYEGIIYEYAHGGTSPVSTLTNYEYGAYTCAADPTTGNLAVFSHATGEDVVAIYPDAQGNPTYYTVPNMNTFPGYLAYDSQGNLFADGYSSDNSWKIWELPNAGSAFNTLTLSQKISALGSLQWVSSYLAVAAKDRIYRVDVSGSDATVVGDTTAQDGRPRAWIQKGTLIEPYASGAREIGFWKYPAGGKVERTLDDAGKKLYPIDSVLVSAASRH